MGWATSWYVRSPSKTEPPQSVPEADTFSFSFRMQTNLTHFFAPSEESARRALRCNEKGSSKFSTVRVKSSVYLEKGPSCPKHPLTSLRWSGCEKNKGGEFSLTKLRTMPPPLKLKRLRVRKTLLANWNWKETDRKGKEFSATRRI